MTLQTNEMEFTDRWSVSPINRAGSILTDLGLAAAAFGVSTQEKTAFECTAVDYHAIAVHLTPVPAHTLLIEDRQVRHGDIRPGAVQIVPAGVAASGEAGAGTYDFVHLYVSDVALRQGADRAGLLDLPEFHDPRYDNEDDRLLGALASEVLNGDGIDALETLRAQDLQHLVVTHLLARYSTARRERRPDAEGPNPLASWRLKRVRDLVEAKLAHPITVEDMAKAADLSAGHFRRVFGQTTGTTPSNYLLRCRIDCARNLLRNPVLPLTEVARQSGFADQQHLTRQFKRRTGLTPGRYRDEILR